MKKLLVSMMVTAMLLTGCSSEESGHYNTVSDSSTSIESIVKEDADSNHIITGVQQIMIGTKCNSYDDALQTLTEIKNAGYESIELNDFMIHKSSLIVKLMTKFSGMSIGNGGKLDWMQLIKESGLKVSSLHSDLGALENDAKAIANEAKSFGTDTVVITGMYRFDYSSLDEVTDLAHRLNAVGKILSEEGVRLLYHNHNCELQKVTKDKTAYDIIIEETDPEYVNFEFDSYWMADINDRGHTKSGPYMTPILKENATELGNGNMDLNTLSEIAKKNGVEGVILETHKNWVDKDPIKSLQVSSEYMKEHFGDNS